MIDAFQGEFLDSVEDGVRCGRFIGPFAVRHYLNNYSKEKGRKIPHDGVLFDVVSGHIVIGKNGIHNHLTRGGGITDLRSLRALMLDPDLNVSGYKFEPKSYKQWEVQDYINYGHWLVNLIRKPDNPEAKILNEEILARASNLGIGPGPRKIMVATPGRRLTGFYQELKIQNVHRIREFDDWSQYDFAAYIRRVGKESGRRPTAKDLRRRNLRNKRNPHPHLIAEKCGGISGVMEYAGYVIVSRWEKQEFIDWGVKFMRANNGQLPVQRKIDYLSKKGVAPGYTSIYKRFQGLNAFQKIVIKEYYEHLKEQTRDRELLLRQLEDNLANGSLPASLLQDIASDDERIKTFAKYEVAKQLGAGMEEETMVKISRGQNDDRGFVASIRRHNDAISIGEIESTAMALGVFSEIWPDDESVKLLVLPQDLQA